MRASLHSSLDDCCTNDSTNEHPGLVSFLLDLFDAIVVVVLILSRRW